MASSLSPPLGLRTRDTASDGTPKPLILGIVGAVVAASILVGLGAYFLLARRRRREYRQALERDQYLTRREFARRRRMSPLQRAEEEETQRRIMIRKSLATRTDTQSSFGAQSRRGPQETDSLGSIGSAGMPSLPFSLPLPSRNITTTTTATAATATSPSSSFYISTSTTGVSEWGAVSMSSLAQSSVSVSGSEEQPILKRASGPVLRDDWKEWEAGVLRGRAGTLEGQHPLLAGSRVSLGGSVEEDRVILVRDRVARAQVDGGSPVPAPQLPRLPDFRDLNEEWRQSTGPIGPTGVQQQHQQQQWPGQEPEVPQLVKKGRRVMGGMGVQWEQEHSIHPLLRRQSRPQSPTKLDQMHQVLWV